MIESIGVQAILINGDLHYPLTGENGLGLSGIRHAAFDLSGQHGGVYVASFYGARRFSLDGMVIGDDVSDFATRRDALHSAFDITQGEQTITFTLSTGRVLTLHAATVALDDSLKAGWPNAAEFHAELEAAYPFYTAAGASMLTLRLGTTGGGTVPATVPMTLSAGAGSTGIAANTGTAPTGPTMRITGPITNPTIRNVTTGLEIRFQTTLATGEYLDVDFQRKTVFDQGGTNRYATKEGDWWTLIPGDNTLQLLADSTDQTAQADVTFFATYLAI